MKIKTHDKSKYLLQLTEHLLVSIDEQSNSDLVVKLQEELTKLLIELQKKLSENKFLSKDCQKIANQVDELIVISANMSQRLCKNQSEFLAEFKEKLWMVLESLEVYCIEYHSITIW